MNSFAAFGQWISENESLLSGAAAMIVLLGVLVSVGSFMLGRLRAARHQETQEPRVGIAAAEVDDDSVITIKKLSAPTPNPVHFALSDGLRIAYSIHGSGDHDILMTPGIISHLNIGAHMPPMRDSQEAIARFARVISFDKQAFERLICNRTAIKQLVTFMKEVDVRPLLKNIHCPCLVIHYAGDMAIPIRMGRALAEGLPNAEFLEINSVDHADLSKSPEAVERIRLFAEEVAR